MVHSDLLFSDEDSFAVQQHQKAAVEAEIAGIDGNRLLNTNVRKTLLTYISSTDIGSIFRFSTKRT